MNRPELIPKYLKKYGYYRVYPYQDVEGNIHNTYIDGGIGCNAFILNAQWSVEVICSSLGIVDCLYKETLELPYGIEILKYIDCKVYRIRYYD